MGGIKDSSTTRMLPPTQCYFLKDARGQFHSKLFISVDFGPRANSFLSACGTKDEPSVEEIANILLNNPKQFYEIAEGRDKYAFRVLRLKSRTNSVRCSYLVELRNIAVNRRMLSSVVIARMKRTPFLLGSRRVKKGESFIELDEENWELEFDLLKPDQILIADDTNEYHLFGDEIFCSPQEDLLEGDALVLIDS
jgi:hypothetical protein